MIKKIMRQAISHRKNFLLSKKVTDLKIIFLIFNEELCFCCEVKQIGFYY